MARVPVTLVTGFLGSGKTTLISRLLGHPDLFDTAVIVNELGEVGIDHHLLRRVDERTVLLGSGCVCCTLRGDLVDELRDLLDRRDAGEIPQFRRVVVETTGVAEPAPIVGTLLTEPFVRHHYELDGLVATVDAVHGIQDGAAVDQAAAADTIVVTKTDLADPEAVEARARALNPTASVITAAFGDIAPSEILGPDRHSLGRLVVDPAPAHEDGIAAHALVLDELLDWTAFGIWLTMLLHARGRDVLRVKGLLDVGEPGPLLVNAVRHAVHPPEHLASWPDEDRRSRLVFIGCDIDAEALEASLRAFNAAARPR